MSDAKINHCSTSTYCNHCRPLSYKYPNYYKATEYILQNSICKGNYNYWENVSKAVSNGGIELLIVVVVEASDDKPLYQNQCNFCRYGPSLYGMTW